MGARVYKWWWDQAWKDLARAGEVATEAEAEEEGTENGKDMSEQDGGDYCCN